MNVPLEEPGELWIMLACRFSLFFLPLLFFLLSFERPVMRIS